MSESRVLSLAWPRQLRPGDGKHVTEAVVLETGSRRIRVEFLFGDAIAVSGPRSVGSNTFEIPGNTGASRIGLTFEARMNAVPGSRHDIAVVLSYVRYVWWRILVGSTLILVAVLPVVAQAIRLSFVSVNLRIGEVVVTSIPCGLLVAVVVGWRRIMAVASSLLASHTRVEEVIGSAGTEVGCIEIVDRSPDSTTAIWSAPGDAAI